MSERWKNFWVPPWVDANFDKLAVFAPLIKDGEKVLWETEDAISKLQPEAQVLVSQAFDTPAFAERLKKLVVFLARRPTRETIKILQRRFTGALFEILAFNYLKSKNIQGELIIAPWETQEGYARIFPAHEATDNYGQNSGIAGISVPDGLIFKVNSEHIYLTGVCEYSLTPHRKVMQTRMYTPENVVSDLFPDQLPFRKAYVDATLGQYLKKQCPEVAPDISLDYGNFRVIWVFPRQNNNHIQLKGEILFLPFFEWEFRKVMNGLFKDLS